MAALSVAQTYHVFTPNPVQYTTGYKVCNETMRTDYQKIKHTSLQDVPM